MTGVAGARKGAAKERRRSSSLAAPVSSREEEGARERAWPTIPHRWAPSRTSFSDRRRDIPTRKPVQGTGDPPRVGAAPGLRRTCARFRGIERDRSSFATTFFLLPLLFRHLTRKFGIEGAANRSLYSNRSNTAAFRMSSERSLRHSPRNPYKDSRRIDRLL